MGIVDRSRKKFHSAVYKFGLIDSGDKIMVAFSGGKDSLTMLDMLYHARKYNIFNCEIVPVYVVPEINGIKTHEKKIEEILSSYCSNYIIQPMQIPQDSKLREGLKQNKPCQWCSYTRRITLFKLAEQLKADKIAYGHHMDDIVTTIFMNIKNYKRLKIMPPLNPMRKGDFSIIRPLSMLRESEIIKYTDKRGFVPLKAECPREDNGERKKTEHTIKNIEKDIPDFVNNMFEAYIDRLGNDYQQF